MEFVKWPSIEVFKFVVHNSASQGTVNYRGKVKLHGTNAAFTFTPTGPVAQSRTQLITPEQDNAGFAAWVAGAGFTGPEGVTVFGEWCGPDVQRGVAVSKLDRKIFAVFAVKVGDNFLTDPNDLRAYAPVHPDVFVLPWYGDEFEINFFSVPQSIVAHMNGQVAAVEAADPWAKEVFGVDGTGEGLVYYPTSDIGRGLTLSVLDDSPDYLGRRVFKAKGEAHRVNGHKEAVAISTALLEGVPEFVAFAVTVARLKQALSEVCPGGAFIQKTGEFLKWVQGDIKKECAEEMAALEAEEGKILGPCGARAVQWFKMKCAEV